MRIAFTPIAAMRGRSRSQMERYSSVKKSSELVGDGNEPIGTGE